MLAETQAPEFLLEEEVSRFRGEADAIAWCWARRRVKYSQREAARLLDIPPSHLSNILSGKKYFGHGKRIEFQRLCGNWAIRQWEDMQTGLITHRESDREREIRLLRQKLAELERAA